MSREEARERFGFFLEAFAYGPPPHAGAALGWDRLAALLAGVDSIREVIAFPKTGAGFDPLTGAPTPITDAQRKEAGIDAEAGGAAAARRAGRPGADRALVGDLRRPDDREALERPPRGRRTSSRRGRPGCGVK